MSLQSTYQSRKELLVENLETMGVTDYSADDGLTTLINAVLEIPVGPVLKELTVTSTKDILSYYDSESATLTATYTENGTGVAGKTVSFTFLHGSITVETQTATTDNTGVASVSYSSKGSGDLSINVECMNLLETYSIEDCLKYWETLSIQGDTSVNYSLPSNFELDFTIYSTKPTTDPSIAYLRFNSSRGIWCGKGDSTSRVVSFFENSFSQITNANTDYNFTLTYENGVATLTDGTNTQTSSQTLTKLYLFSSKGGSQLKNIKLKQL